jgi:DNA repair photolyase
VKNKLVVIDDATNPIKPADGFFKKGLADSHLELCGLCGFGCSYCSTNNGNTLRINRKHLADLTEQQLGKRLLPAQDPSLMFVFPNILDALRAQLARVRRGFGAGKTLVVSMLTDAFSPELIKQGITEEALRLVLLRTDFRIRILTKCSTVGTPRWINFFLRHQDRFVVGLSTGTLDDTWARKVEIGTSSPTARLRALHALQNAGIATFGMACPIFPGVLDADRLEHLVDAIRPNLVEDFWAEPYNDRTNWRCVRDGYAAGSPDHRWLTDVYEHQQKPLWSSYATEIYSRLVGKATREGWGHKLKYLLYEGLITPTDATRFAGLEGVLLQSKPGDDGKTNNEYLRQWDRRTS